jgi:hypothetical protein
VTFEYGSKLSTLGAWAFLLCGSLKSISFPASLRQFTGLSLAGSELTDINFGRD